MLISPDHIDEASLAGLGAEVVELLCSGQLASLAQQFGYALAFGREPVAALEEDMRERLAQANAVSFVAKGGADAISVKYFKPNDTGLFAVIECDVDTDNGLEALVELVVTRIDTGFYITLEQISLA